MSISIEGPWWSCVPEQNLAMVGALVINPAYEPCYVFAYEHFTLPEGPSAQSLHDIQLKFEAELGRAVTSGPRVKS